MVLGIGEAMAGYALLRSAIAGVKGAIETGKDAEISAAVESAGTYWVKIEDDVRQTMTNTDTKETQKSGFINNSNTTTLTDGSSTTNERVALSKLLKPKADN